MSFQQAIYDEKNIYELSEKGKIGYSLPEPECPVPSIPDKLKRKTALGLPEGSEVEVVRHYTRLSQMNFGVDSGMYPLGSCTMKYNPKLNEQMANLDGFTGLHPYQREKTAQGAIQLIYELQGMLSEIAGMDETTLQPAAGAHSEFLGMLIVRNYFRNKGELDQRTNVLVPDSAHGTNPASAAMAGFNVIEIPSAEDGCVDLDALMAHLDQHTAAFMLTNPNTLGIFEKNILKIAEAVHDAGALLYYDGANLNAIMGKVRPGDMGFDIVHFNLHKTLSTPHGGGGPGGGAIAVKKKLADLLPVPMARLDTESGRYYMDYNIPHTIGKIRGYFGNFGVMVRAYAYIKVMGGNGLKEVSEMAVLNSNYMKHLILKETKGAGDYSMPFGYLRKHEFVLSGEGIKKDLGVPTKDLVKGLLDRGLHAPTIYFPHLVHEAMMIEPTETEDLDSMNAFVEALKEIRDQCERDPDSLKTAPINTASARVDEVQAARKPVLSWKMKE